MRKRISAFFVTLFKKELHGCSLVIQQGDWSVKIFEVADGRRSRFVIIGVFVNVDAEIPVRHGDESVGRNL